MIDPGKADAVKEWYRQRIETIHKRVSVHDLLRMNGIKLRHTGDREEQFSCPFHGADAKPSARAFPDSPMGPSHAWCFVCKERWDVISLWKKYSGEDKTFHRILSEIEKHFGLETPEVPQGVFGDSSVSKGAEFQEALMRSERRLLSVRGDYRAMGDMVGYLTAGSVLDRVQHQVSEGHLSFADGVKVLNQLCDKINQRVRHGSTGKSQDL